MLENEAKKLIVDIGRRMYEAGFVASNDGNISIRLDDGSIIATPSGVSKGYMNEEMLIKIDGDGNVLAGSGKVSSEIKMHLIAYKTNPDINSVCHSHSPYATSFASAEQPLDCTIIAESVLSLGSVPCIPYEELGTERVALGIKPYLFSHGGLLMAHHGVVTWGKDIMQAYSRMESIEHLARINLYSKLIGGGVSLRADEIAALEQMRSKFGIDYKKSPVYK